MRKVNYIKILLASAFVIGSLTACGGENSNDEISYDTAFVNVESESISEKETIGLETDESNDNISESVTDEIGNEANESESQPAERKLYATTTVKIREMPNTDSNVLALIGEGQEVIEYEAGADGWSKVSCEGVDGYIKSEYLTQEVPNAAGAQSNTPASAVTPYPVQNTPVSESTALVTSVSETLETSIPNSNSIPSAQQPTQQHESTLSDHSEENGNGTSSGGTGVTVPQQEETGANLVWVPTNGGTKYHSKASCSGMNEPIQVSLDTAIANGYTACKRCH